MKESSAGVGDPGVFASNSPSGLGAIAGAAARSRQGAGIMSQPSKPACQRAVRMPAADLGPIRSRGDGEGNKAQIHPDKPADLRFRTLLMAVYRMEVGGTDVERHVPAGASPHDGGERDPGASSDLLFSRDGIDLRSGSEQSPKPAGIVMDPDPPNRGQCHRPRMSLPDTNQLSAWLTSIPEAETVAAATFTLAPGNPT